MISFLKNFLSGEKSAEEQALLAQAAAPKKRDILSVDAYAPCDMDETQEEPEYCRPAQGCGGCGCRN